MSFLKIALEQAKSSRLMRVAVTLWVAWIFFAVALLAVGFYALGTGDEDGIYMIATSVISVPICGVALWFIAGAIRWVISPKV